MSSYITALSAHFGSLILDFAIFSEKKNNGKQGRLIQNVFNKYGSCFLHLSSVLKFPECLMTVQYKAYSSSFAF